jgi:hypothetical protein
MNKPVDIGDIKFPTRVSAYGYFSHMLQTYKLNDRIDPPSKEFKILHSALEKHPRFKQKRRRGVAAFIVSYSPKGQGQCFWVLRTDGSLVDFSIRKCIDN